MNEQKQQSPEDKTRQQMAASMGVAIVLGIALGAAFDNIGLGLALGIIIGGIGAAWRRGRSR